MSATAPVWRRWLWPVALTVAVLTSTWWPAIDRFAGEQVDAALTRALVAFALARGLDGVISVAQSAELAIEPAGIGVSLHPGELLDPINDLVESFSSVMLFAAASLGLQKLLLGISSWWPLKLLLTAAMLGLLLARAGRFHRSPWPPRVARLATLLLILRFAVPVSALASEGCYRLFLEPEYTRSSAAIEQARLSMSIDARALKPQLPADASWYEQAQQWLGQQAARLDIDSRIAALEATATEVSRQVINLIVVFVAQTVILPLLFLWLMIRIGRLMLAIALGATRG